MDKKIQSTLATPTREQITSFQQKENRFFIQLFGIFFYRLFAMRSKLSNNSTAPIPKLFSLPRRRRLLSRATVNKEESFHILFCRITNRLSFAQTANEGVSKCERKQAQRRRRLRPLRLSHQLEKAEDSKEEDRGAEAEQIITIKGNRYAINTNFNKIDSEATTQLNEKKSADGNPSPQRIVFKARHPPMPRRNGKNQL